MKKEPTFNSSNICKNRILAIKDTMEILSEKWKFHILGTILQTGKMHFTELLREVNGIGPKMLSNELQDMVLNQLLLRRVLKTKPIMVEYEITDFGRTLTPIIDKIAKWGTDYRKSFHTS